MGILKSRLEQSHQDEIYDVTARLLVESAIKVESTRLQTEEEWRERLNQTQSDLEDKLTALDEIIHQVWYQNILDSFSKDTVSLTNN